MDQILNTIQERYYSTEVMSFLMDNQQLRPKGKVQRLFRKEVGLQAIGDPKKQIV